MRVVGQAPHDYRCDTCPASERANRRCDRDGDGEPKGARWLAEGRRRGAIRAADPKAPDACALLRLEATPRAGQALGDSALWREHGLGPVAHGRAGQALWWLEAQDVVVATREALDQERRQQAEADRRADEAGLPQLGRRR